MAKTYLILPIEYDEAKTDPEALCYAFDTLLETAMSTPGVLSEYGPITAGSLRTFPENPRRGSDVEEPTWRLPLPNGGQLVCYAGTAVHIYDENSNEIVMWVDTEWEEDPQDVMNAIFGWATQQLVDQVHDRTLDVENKCWVGRPLR